MNIAFDMKSFMILPIILIPTFMCAQSPNVTEFDETNDYNISLSQKQLWSKNSKTEISWGNTDTRYERHVPAPKQHQSVIEMVAWRGERVNAQAVICSLSGIKNLSYTFTNLKDKKGNRIASSSILGGFVRYVMTDKPMNDGRYPCDYRPPKKEKDSIWVADIIDTLAHTLKVPPMSVQPIWVRCWIPEETIPGTYKGEMYIKDGDQQIGKLTIVVKVLSHILPEPHDWSYHLDLWQNPFAVARYYNVPLWSKAHFDAMRPMMKMLAEAGQKAITTTIVHKPWSGQTYDYYENMVTWIKKTDGSWKFDYTIFDKWVEFMIDLGIDKQINCYSMVPYQLSFQYYDQASNSYKSIDAEPGDKAYEEVWISMLQSFSNHLREKGWMNICSIATDERSDEEMFKTLQVIKKANPDFKVSMTGVFHSELEKDIYDYCIPIGAKYPLNVIQERTKGQKPTTYYTCCTETHPNTFTFSNPAEAVWISYYIAKNNLSGYLRWAYNSWSKRPLIDSRYASWVGGDTYLIYPGARTSIRFEKLIEGIQAYEKIMILRKEYIKESKSKALNDIKQILSTFNLDNFPKISADITVNDACRRINEISEK
jgi:hypothetical protein